MRISALGLVGHPLESHTASAVSFESFNREHRSQSRSACLGIVKREVKNRFNLSAPFKRSCRQNRFVNRNDRLMVFSAAFFGSSTSSSVRGHDCTCWWKQSRSIRRNGQWTVFPSTRGWKYRLSERTIGKQSQCGSFKREQHRHAFVDECIVNRSYRRTIVGRICSVAS